MTSIRALPATGDSPAIAQIFFARMTLSLCVGVNELSIVLPPFSYIFYGTVDGGRTRMSFTSLDFESSASANFATTAGRLSAILDDSFTPYIPVKISWCIFTHDRNYRFGSGRNLIHIGVYVRQTAP